MSDRGSAQKNPFDFRIKPQREAPKPRVQMCEMPGCGKPGPHKAPKSKTNLREHRWLCLDHVRWVRRGVCELLGRNVGYLVTNVARGAAAR